MVQQVVEIEISSLQANPLQPRGLITSESLVDLVESIKEHGILEPLMVAKTPAGYQIIAGERRWRAAKLAGLKTVPTIIRETSPRGMLEMALVENVQREDLNPLERAQAFIRLMEEFSLTNKEIAKRISKSPAYISNSIKLLSLPDALKDGLLSGLISEGHARALAAIQNPKLMVDAYKIILREKASVRRTEDVARRMKKKAGQPLHPAGVRSATVVSDEIDQMARKLTQALGDDDSVGVKLIRSRIQTKILIVLKGSLIDTEERLQKIYKNITSK
ncbi:MAG TPA: ParB/RepB/Spo0J family partition protein [Nevskiaceae bacterium]|nr:ParB/RepB/Spo0J family partition protein [Nevskiaceae bacterium]